MDGFEEKNCRGDGTIGNFGFLKKPMKKKPFEIFQLS